MIPYEYVNALDALPSFSPMMQLRWRCSVDELRSLLNERVPNVAQAPNLVWVEPQVGESLPIDPSLERLIVIASCPLMRLIPERREWQDAPLGMARGGLRRLNGELSQAGWQLEHAFRFHTLSSIGLNLLGQQMARVGQPARADRWQMKARLHYVGKPPMPGSLGLLVFDLK